VRFCVSDRRNENPKIWLVMEGIADNVQTSVTAVSFLAGQRYKASVLS
jgi:hypothetical protein